MGVSDSRFWQSNFYFQNYYFLTSRQALMLRYMVPLHTVNHFYWPIGPAGYFFVNSYRVEVGKVFWHRSFLTVWWSLILFSVNPLYSTESKVFFFDSVGVKQCDHQWLDIRHITPDPVVCVKEYQKKRFDTISFPLPLNQPDSWEASNLNIKKYPTDLLVITYSNNN